MNSKTWSSIGTSAELQKCLPWPLPILEGLSSSLPGGSQSGSGNAAPPCNERERYPYMRSNACFKYLCSHGIRQSSGPRQRGGFGRKPSRKSRNFAVAPIYGAICSATDLRSSVPPASSRICCKRGLDVQRRSTGGVVPEAQRFAAASTAEMRSSHACCGSTSATQRAS